MCDCPPLPLVLLGFQRFLVRLCGLSILIPHVFSEQHILLRELTSFDIIQDLGYQSLACIEPPSQLPPSQLPPPQSRFDYWPANRLYALLVGTLPFPVLCLI